jgi:hypothetical protein
MKVQVSRLFKVICGDHWRDVAKELVQDTLFLAEMRPRKGDTYCDSIHLPVVITFGTNRATIAVSLDRLSELEAECEIRMEGESKQRKRR